MSEQRWTLHGCDSGGDRWTEVASGPDVEAGRDVEVVPASRLAEVQQDLGEMRLAFDALEDRLERACEALEEADRIARDAFNVGGVDVERVGLTRILAVTAAALDAIRSVPAREETRA